MLFRSNPHFLPDFNPNRPGPPPRTIYDIRDQENSDIQYYWASVAQDSYFAVAGQRLRPVLVAVIPPNCKCSAADRNVPYSTEPGNPIDMPQIDNQPMDAHTDIGVDGPLLASDASSTDFRTSHIGNGVEFAHASSMTYSYLLASQSYQTTASDLSILLKLLKLFLEETATRPARVEDLNPLEFACIADLSAKFGRGLPSSTAVKACSEACGL